MISENSENTSIAIVGCGKMGEAILRGWLNSHEGEAAALSAQNFKVVQPDTEQAKRIAKEYGVEVVDAVSELINDARPLDIVLLAVKPQIMPAVLEEFATAKNLISPDSLFITIAAGLPTAMFEAALTQIIDAPARVVRVMPNMPLQVGMGASAVAKGVNASDDDLQLVNSLFEALGTSLIVDEEQIDAVCAISGGGPAYFAYMVESLTDAGCELGLSRTAAEQLALATMGGTYHAIIETQVTPAQMRESVCSPGGTTLAALAALDDANFTQGIKSAMRAAVNRAAEIRNSN